MENLQKIISEIIAEFIPDFILLNLKKTDIIIENMSMRGFGTEKRRSARSSLK